MQKRTWWAIGATLLAGTAALAWHLDLINLLYPDTRPFNDWSKTRPERPEDFVPWGVLRIPDGRLLVTPLGSFTAWPATTMRECKSDLARSRLEELGFGIKEIQQTVPTPEGARATGVQLSAWCAQLGKGQPIWARYR